MNQTKQTRSGPLHPRLAISFLLLPLSLGVIGMLWAAATYLVSDLRLPAATVVFCAAAVLAALLPPGIAYVGGVLLWAPTVRWTRRRRPSMRLLHLAAAVTMAAGLGVTILSSVFWLFLVLFASSLILAGIALIVMNRICYDPPDVGDEMPCPACGYDLRGQRECRCPECGRRYTVGELVNRSQLLDPLGCY